MQDSGKIDGDYRKRKAVKSNDAAILEYLWKEHLADDDMCSWTPCDWVGLQYAIDLLRQRMLRLWKKRVTTFYLPWLKEEHPWFRKKEARVAKGEVNLQRDACERVQSWWQHREDRYCWKPGVKQDYKSWW
jgi:hypothetical protein